MEAYCRFQTRSGPIVGVLFIICLQSLLARNLKGYVLKYLKEINKSLRQKVTFLF